MSNNLKCIYCGKGIKPYKSYCKHCGFVFAKDELPNQISETDCACESEEVTTKDRIDFANKMLKSCIKEAIVFKYSTAFYCCESYCPTSPWDYLPDDIEVPDEIYSEDAAKIDTIFFCDPPKPSEEKDILSDLKKLSSLKRLLFMTSAPSFRFRVRLLLTMPKVKLAYRACADQDDVSILEHLTFMLNIEAPFRIWWRRLLWAIPKVKIADKQIDVAFDKDTGRCLEGFFDD